MKTFLALVQKIFLEKEVRDISVDENRLLEIHRKIVNKKKLLHSAFNAFYKLMSDNSDKFITAKGLEIELGSGSGFFKNARPGLITSDVRIAEYIDIFLDAQKMKLKNDSVRVFYGINVFHHLPNPEIFFKEAIRTLKTGGGIILIEPHNGIVSSTVHKLLHKNEYFDNKMSGWKNYQVKGPLSGANQALSHIVFIRDREIFEKKFGKKLVITHHSYVNNWLRYFFSGGVNFKQLLPSFIEKPFIIIEKILSPFAKHLSLHHIIVIKKISS
jgi:SAM-dependent methyltransferase